VKDEVLKRLEGFLDDSTGYGLFQIIASSIDGNDLSLLTTTIPDLALAFEVLKDATGQEYNLGRSVPVLALDERLSIILTYLYFMRRILRPSAPSSRMKSVEL